MAVDLLQSGAKTTANRWNTEHLLQRYSLREYIYTLYETFSVRRHFLLPPRPVHQYRVRWRHFGIKSGAPSLSPPFFFLSIPGTYPGQFLALTAAALVYFATIALRGTQPLYSLRITIYGSPYSIHFAKTNHVHSVGDNFA